MIAEDEVVPFIWKTEIVRDLFSSENVIGDERFRDLLARALMRVPIDHLLSLMSSRALFILTSPTTTEYLSGRIVRERGVALFGSGIFDLPEELQIETVLRLASRCYNRSKHPADWPPSPESDRPLMDPQTGEWDRSAANKIAKEAHSQSCDHQIDLFLADRDADRMLESWKARWDEFAPRLN